MHFSYIEKEGFLMSHKNYESDLYQTNTKGAGSLGATKWYQVLCNRVRVMKVIGEN